ncbi:MAG: cysteine hydrolase family protein [Kiloniellales bacterium]
MDRLPDTAALVLIDLQKAIDDPRWGSLSNPQVANAAARLLAAWRKSGRPVIHVQHLSRKADSPYRPGPPGCDFKPEVAPAPGELLVQKEVNSAFIGTGLEALLRTQGIDTLVFGGVLTQNSLETTVRMAANLGFATYVAAEATSASDIVDLDGRHWSATEVQALSLANMNSEYATVTDGAALLGIFG